MVAHGSTLTLSTVQPSYLYIIYIAIVKLMFSQPDPRSPTVELDDPYCLPNGYISEQRLHLQ